jgi:hypothetical protein
MTDCVASPGYQAKKIDEQEIFPGFSDQSVDLPGRHNNTHNMASSSPTSRSQRVAYYRSGSGSSASAGVGSRAPPAGLASIIGAAASANTTSAGESLQPRTLARLAREVRDFIRPSTTSTSLPEGVRLIVDEDTGLPVNLSELWVSDLVWVSLNWVRFSPLTIFHLVVGRLKWMDLLTRHMRDDVSR